MNSRVALSAGIRVGGAALVLAGLVVGVRVLGPLQFGVSVLALSVGQLLAFPLTAMERLVIRSVAQGEVGLARSVLRRGDQSAILVLTLAAAAAVASVMAGRQSTAMFILAAGVSAASAGVVTLRQGASRAQGHLGWGQIPNEVVRPIVTLLSYPVAAALMSEESGALSTLLASGATLLVIVFSPKLDREQAHPDVRPRPSWGGAATSLLVVSGVALMVERAYPLLIGWAGNELEVAAFAVVMRVIQIAKFFQAFAIFYYSPHIARQVSECKSWSAPQVNGSFTSRIRIMGLASSIPTALFCVLWPDLIERALGSEIAIGPELRAAAVIIMATALSGPAQTLLIMAGRERAVAWAYVVGGMASLASLGFSGQVDALAATVAVAVASLSWGIIQVGLVRHRFAQWH